jgi:hypothetical protein
MPTRRFRVGIICRDAAIDTIAADCVRRMLRVSGVELSLFVQDRRRPAPAGPCERVLGGRSRASLLWCCYRRLFPLSAAPLERSPLLQGVPAVSCGEGRPEQGAESFSRSEVGQIRAFELDALVDFTGRALEGEILSAAKHGVWRLRLSERHSGPAAFWEIYYGEPVTSAVLERLTQDPNCAEVLQRCFERTQFDSHRKNFRSIVSASRDLPARACHDALYGLASGQEATGGLPVPAYRTPSSREMVRFLSRVVRTTVAQNLRAIVGQAEQWNIGLVEAPIHRFLEPGFRPSVHWMTYTGRDQFAADPFGIALDDTLLVLFEAFDLRAGRGLIKQVILADGRASPPVTAIDSGDHLAYPFLVEHQGTTYCLPESSGRRELALYRFEPSTRTWSKHATLIGGTAIVDASLARYGGYWWIFAADYDDHPLSKLFAWYARDLFGPWQPHGANPIKIDVRSARPGGTPFEHQGSLYRPAQDNALTYGKRITINRIVRLTPHEFEEQPAAVVESPSARYPAGLHTLAALGEYTLIDAKRMELKPYLIPGRLRHKLRRLASILR